MKKILLSTLIAVVMCFAFTASSNAQYLKIRCLLEGYMEGGNPSGQMVPALANWNMWNHHSTDIVDVIVWDANYLNQYQIETAVLTRKGECTIRLSSFLVGQNINITIVSRNHLRTCTAKSFKVKVCENYLDFTSAQGVAMGGVQVDVSATAGAPPGTLWAFYSGDINQDGAIDSDDYLLLVNAMNVFGYGCEYSAEDLNGDGNVDLIDYSIQEPNITNGITSPCN